MLHLVEGIPKGQNYKVFMDNWFTSFSLMCALKEIGILALGTVRISIFPGCSLKTEEGLKKLGREADDYRTEAGTNVLALKWYDNKPVYLVSTYKGRHPVETVKRRSVAERRYVEVPRPEMVKEYNCHMGGVDLQDMLVALYRTNIGVKRFYLCIVFHLLDVCSKCVASVPSPLLTEGNYQVQNSYHLPVRYSTHSSQGGENKEKWPVYKRQL